MCLSSFSTTCSSGSQAGTPGSRWGEAFLAAGAASHARQQCRCWRAVAARQKAHCCYLQTGRRRVVCKGRSHRFTYSSFCSPSAGCARRAEPSSGRTPPAGTHAAGGCHCQARQQHQVQHVSEAFRRGQRASSRHQQLQFDAEEASAPHSLHSKQPQRVTAIAWHAVWPSPPPGPWCHLVSWHHPVVLAQPHHHVILVVVAASKSNGGQGSKQGQARQETGLGV